MNDQKKLFSFMITFILINSLTSTLSEVSQNYQKELSSGKMTESELEEFMQSIISEATSTKAHLKGNNFAERLANFYLNDFSNYYPEQNSESFSIQQAVKDLVDKHKEEIINENPEAFFEEVLPLLKDFYSYQILVKQNEDEIYEFNVLIKYIEHVISIKKEKSAAYEQLRNYVLTALKNFTQESFNLFSITNAEDLKILINASGSELFNNLWENADSMDELAFNENADKLFEIIRGFLIICIDVHKNENQKPENERANLPTQYSLVYHILRTGKRSMEKKANSERQNKLMTGVARASSEIYYSLLNEEIASAATIYMMYDFFTFSSNQGVEIEKFVSQFMYEKYVKDGLVPAELNNAQRRYFWIDVFNKVVSFHVHVGDKEEIRQLMENLENVFAITPVELELSRSYLDVFKTNLTHDDISPEFFVPLEQLYNFYQTFLTTQTEIVDKSTLLGNFQDYILQIRSSEHPELNEESSEPIVQGNISDSSMALGDNYLLFELSLLNESLNPDFTYKFAKNFSKAELSNVINNFQNSQWDDLRKLNYCVWKKVTNNNFSQELVSDIKYLEDVFKAFVGRSITQATVDDSFTVTESGGKGC